MSRDDHIDDPNAVPILGPILGPDDPVVPGEQALAESLARSIDRLVDGADLPPAMDSEERALVQVAGIVRAAFHHAELADDRRDALIGQALARGASSAGRADAPAPGSPEQDSPATDSVIDLGAQRRRRLGRVIPWAIATAAAAAVLLLLVTRPDPRPRVAHIDPPVSVPVEHRSRPTDDLIGQIRREHVGHARERVDMIFADRMAGYRDLSLSGGAR